MAYRPYPNPDRARKHAVLHGRRVVGVDLAPLLAGVDWSHDEERVQRLVDSLPSGTIEFSTWFPQSAEVGR